MGMGQNHFHISGNQHSFTLFQFIFGYLGYLGSPACDVSPYVTAHFPKAPDLGKCPRLRRRSRSLDAAEGGQEVVEVHLRRGLLGQLLPEFATKLRSKGAWEIDTSTDPEISGCHGGWRLQKWRYPLDTRFLGPVCGDKVI